jgi:hypothetical protein
MIATKRRAISATRKRLTANSLRVWSANEKDRLVPVKGDGKSKAAEYPIATGV